ncbi:unannotated protein [freshwater metagenome]|uniref:Unannotated protein n=1 Tax=freshwater metagenome TaxID=449393 RepID=A0A6J6RNM0_9ZZZZ
MIAAAGPLVKDIGHLGRERRCSGHRPVSAQPQVVRSSISQSPSTRTMVTVTWSLEARGVL